MNFRATSRGWRTALGLMAVLAALLQPLCAAYAAAQDADHEAVQCCAEVEAGALVGSSPSAQSPHVSSAPPAGSAAAFSGTPLVARHSYRIAAWSGPPQLPSLSYYARSARIQR